MRKASLILSLCLCLLTVETQAQRGFVVKGDVGLPDGYAVGICCHTDTAYSVEVASGYVKDGKFTLTGRLDHPLDGTLMTNNLELVSRNNWPTDSIHWTYTEVFLSNDDIFVDRNLNVTGGEVQTDYNDYQKLVSGNTENTDGNSDNTENTDGNSDNTDGNSDNSDNKDWAFIAQHPQSVVSVFLANNLLKRGYNLTSGQVAWLEKTITSVPGDTVRMNEFRQRIAYAKNTTKGGSIIDLELRDTLGNLCRLTDIVPPHRYVLVDFWASWCGICIHAMPAIRQIAEEYKDKFAVVAVSIDTKKEAWRKAMAKHPEPWPQYITTPQGYDDFFHKYQVGNGVPYYLMITPDGKVLNSPSSPEAVRAILENYQ